MDMAMPRRVDTVVIGNGPSALILSYILHGHIPVYNQSSPHPDNLLHEKLVKIEDLLCVDVDRVTDHFGASRFSYSTQALPVNVLLDTLIRPHGETDDTDNKTCIKWEHDASRAVSHVVIGKTAYAGGQWADNPVKASWDIGALSYAEMLSLPGYSFAQFYLEHFGKHLPVYLRPSRRQIAGYFAAYPAKVEISDSLHCSQEVFGVRREGFGFYISSHNIFCDHLVLASGIFTSLISPRPLLQPLLSLPDPFVTKSNNPILVIGSGFSAADVIISTPATRKIIHIYKWAPSKAPSRLRACHQQAYPEYAGVYRKMKLAALSHAKHTGESKAHRSMIRRASSSAIDPYRDWDLSYEGLPNTAVVNVDYHEDQQSATITLQSGSDAPFQRTICGLAYVVGRRGSLEYLEPGLQQEVCPSFDTTQGLSGRDLRDKANENLEVARNVFIVGSLTGDTLIRFAYGGCCNAAGKIMNKSSSIESPTISTTTTTTKVTNKSTSNNHQSKPGNSSHNSNGKVGNEHGSVSSPTSTSSQTYISAMNGLDGHHQAYPSSSYREHNQHHHSRVNTNSTVIETSTSNKKTDRDISALDRRKVAI